MDSNKPLWVVLAKIDYSPGDFIGAFDSEEKAKELMISTKLRYIYNDVVIKKIQVNQIYDDIEV